jgi:hypothetical protein
LTVIVYIIWNRKEQKFNSSLYDVYKLYFIMIFLSFIFINFTEIMFSEKLIEKKIIAHLIYKKLTDKPRENFSEIC